MLILCKGNIYIWIYKRNIVYKTNIHMCSLSKGNNGRINQNNRKKWLSIREGRKEGRTREERRISLKLILFYRFDYETMEIFY